MREFDDIIGEYLTRKPVPRPVLKFGSAKEPGTGEVMPGRYVTTFVQPFEGPSINKIKLSGNEICGRCEGKGTVPATGGAIRCPECRGIGVFTWTEADEVGAVTVYESQK